jgi:hypothetical protein
MDFHFPFGWDPILGVYELHWHAKPRGCRGTLSCLCSRGQHHLGPFYKFLYRYCWKSFIRRSIDTSDKLFSRGSGRSADSPDRCHFIINLLMISLILFIFGIAPNWKAIFFPLALIPIFLIGTGIGLVVAVITVVVQDINKMISAGLGFLMFLTPVIYAPKFENKIIQNVVKWNPMSYLIVGARDIILYGRIEYTAGYFYSCLLAIVVFMLSWRFFFLSEYKVAEKL